MDHPRFVSGDITTGFIAEEYPDGFAGVDLDEASSRLAALAAHLHLVRERRAAAISGSMRNHRREPGRDWVVSLSGARLAVSVERDGAGARRARRRRAPRGRDRLDAGATLVAARVGGPR
jgi:propionyl-CoA carboxylase alpha chain